MIDACEEFDPIPVLAAVMVFVGIVLIAFSIGGASLALFSSVLGAVAGLIVGDVTTR